MGGRPRRQPPRLGRRAPTKDPKTKIYIVCEGELTEPQYFAMLARQCSALIRIDLVFQEGAGVPVSILNKAREIIKRPKDEFSYRDQVWAVFDRDEHLGVDQVISEAAAGILVAYSNPCFELWLILHFPDHDRPDGRHELQRILRSLMPGYDPRKSKQVTFGAVCDGVEDAETRAEAMERRRIEENVPNGNPCSTVYKLTRVIRAHGRNT